MENSGMKGVDEGKEVGLVVLVGVEFGEFGDVGMGEVSDVGDVGPVVGCGEIRVPVI
jgi:hypothetical protein